MTVHTHVSDALDRVTDEQLLVEQKQAALRQFRQTIEDLSAQGPDARSRPPHVTDGGMTAAASTLCGDRSASTCKQVCTAFGETVAPCCQPDTNDGDAVLSALRDELGDEVALALAPNSDSQFTPQVKRAVVSATVKRQEELGTFAAALETEETSVRTIEDTVESITDWLTTADETPLSTLEFDRLRTRHETLAAHRDQCHTAITQRQETLNGTTSQNGSVGVAHRSVVRSLYEQFPVPYPVLGILTRLAECCQHCQRTVRDHLVRRV
jgi:hypothetical protein